MVATDDELGKPAGNDLIQGVYTLPVIRVLAAGGPEADRLGELLGRPLSEPERDEARNLVRASGQLDGALEVARGFAHDAADALEAVAGLRGRHRADRRLRPPDRGRSGGRQPLSPGPARP